MKNFKIIILSVVAFALLSSCGLNMSEPKNTGIFVNKDVLASIRQELADKENSLLAKDGDVFWSKSGTIWHSSHTCSYLANSKVVYHGTVDEAKLEGKQRACSRCCGGEAENIYDQIADNPIRDGDVFFSQDGVLWHTIEECPIVLGEGKVYHGNISLAVALGKTEPCDKCSNNE